MHQIRVNGGKVETVLIVNKETYVLVPALLAYCYGSLGKSLLLWTLFSPCKTLGGEMNSVVLKSVLTESYGNLLQSTDAQAQNRTIKSESLEGKALAFVFYKISTLDSIV